MTNQKKIVFSEVFDTSLDEFNEQEQTLMHSVESTINNIDVDRNELYKLGFIDSEIDLINNEKKRVMDNLKFYFSIYFFSGIIYCSLHTFKFYRKELPIRKSLYPWGFLLTSFYIFTIYSMKTFNSKMTNKIKDLLITKKFLINKIGIENNNRENDEEKILIENKLKFYKFFKDRNILISQIKY